MLLHDMLSVFLCCKHNEWQNNTKIKTQILQHKDRNMKIATQRLQHEGCNTKVTTQRLQHNDRNTTIATHLPTGPYCCYSKVRRMIAPAQDETRLTGWVLPHAASLCPAAIVLCQPDINRLSQWGNKINTSHEIEKIFVMITDSWIEGSSSSEVLSSLPWALFWSIDACGHAHDISACVYMYALKRSAIT